MQKNRIYAYTYWYKCAYIWSNAISTAIIQNGDKQRKIKYENIIRDAGQDFVENKPSTRKYTITQDEKWISMPQFHTPSTVSRWSMMKNFFYGIWKKKRRNVDPLTDVRRRERVNVASNRRQPTKEIVIRNKSLGRRWQWLRNYNYNTWETIIGAGWTEHSNPRRASTTARRTSGHVQWWEWPSGESRNRNQTHRPAWHCHVGRQQPARARTLPPSQSVCS